MSRKELETKMAELLMESGGRDWMMATAQRGAACMALRFVLRTETWPVFLEFARSDGLSVDRETAGYLQILLTEAAQRFRYEGADDESLVGAVSPADQAAARDILAELHASIAAERRSGSDRARRED
jgi:hypothetical protein